MIHANAMDRVNLIRDEILKARPDLGEIKAYPLTPVVGAHAGPGTVCVGYILKK